MSKLTGCHCRLLQLLTSCQPRVYLTGRAVTPTSGAQIGRCSHSDALKPASVSTTTSYPEEHVHDTALPSRFASGLASQQISRDIKKITTRFSRLEHKYSALLKFNEEYTAKSEREKKVWKRFKTIVNTVSQSTTQVHPSLPPLGHLFRDELRRAEREYEKEEARQEAHRQSKRKVREDERLLDITTVRADEVGTPRPQQSMQKQQANNENGSGLDTPTQLQKRRRFSPPGQTQAVPNAPSAISSINTLRTSLRPIRTPPRQRSAKKNSCRSSSSKTSDTESTNILSSQNASERSFRTKSDVSADPPVGTARRSTTARPSPCAQRMTELNDGSHQGASEGQATPRQISVRAVAAYEQHPPTDSSEIHERDVVLAQAEEQGSTHPASDFESEYLRVLNKNKALEDEEMLKHFLDVDDFDPPVVDQEDLEEALPSHRPRDGDSHSYENEWEAMVAMAERDAQNAGGSDNLESGPEPPSSMLLEESIVLPPSSIEGGGTWDLRVAMAEREQECMRESEKSVDSGPQPPSSMLSDDNFTSSKEDHSDGHAQPPSLGGDRFALTISPKKRDFTSSAAANRQAGNASLSAPGQANTTIPTSSARPFIFPLPEEYYYEPPASQMLVEESVRVDFARRPVSAKDSPRMAKDAPLARSAYTLRRRTTLPSPRRAGSSAVQDSASERTDDDSTQQSTPRQPPAEPSSVTLRGATSSAGRSNNTTAASKSPASPAASRRVLRSATKTNNGPLSPAGISVSPSAPSPKTRDLFNSVSFVSPGKEAVSPPTVAKVSTRPISKGISPVRCRSAYGKSSESNASATTQTKPLSSGKIGSSKRDPFRTLLRSDSAARTDKAVLQTSQEGAYRSGVEAADRSTAERSAVVSQIAELRRGLSELGDGPARPPPSTSDTPPARVVAGNLGPISTASIRRTTGLSSAVNSPMWIKPSARKKHERQRSGDSPAQGVALAVEQSTIKTSSAFTKVKPQAAVMVTGKENEQEKPVSVTETPETLPQKGEAMLSSSLPSSSARPDVAKRQGRRSASGLPDDIASDLDEVGRRMFPGRKSFSPALGSAAPTSRAGTSKPASAIAEIALPGIEANAFVAQKGEKLPFASTASRPRVATRGKDLHNLLDSDMGADEEEFPGQRFMREIHQRRKQELKADPLRYKGRGAYASQLA